MRKKPQKVDIIIIAVILLLIAGGILLALLPQNEQQSANIVSADTDGDGSITYKDYIGKRIGIQTGSSFEPITFEYLPGSEYLYYDSKSDLAVALEQNKIDAFLMDEPDARMLHSENSSLDYIKQPLINDDYSFMFRKGSPRSDKLCQQFNEMLANLRAGGRLDEITEKWFGTDDSVKTFDRAPSSGENGEIVVAGLPDSVPFSYYLNNEYTGFAVELITIFSQEYDYSIKFEQPNVTALFAGVTSGKYDIGIGSISVTEERTENAVFSDTVYSGGVVLIARASDISQTDGASVEDRPFSYYAENKKIGAITGGLYEIMIRERYPEAEILQYNNQPDMAVALGAGVIDAFTCPESTAKDFIKADPSLTYLNEVFMKIPYGFAFEKSAEKEYLRDQMNEFLKKLHSDGTYDELVAEWFGDDDSVKTVDLSGLTGENGKIRYITAPTMQPFSYIVNGGNAGFEVEIVARFCREYGYSLTIDNAEFASLIPGITSGMYDIASGTIMITEERAESVNFSDVYYTANAVAVVKRESDDLKRVREFRKVGTLTRTVYDKMLADVCPDAEVNYYDAYSDMLLALKTGILDSFVADDVYLKYIGDDDPSVSYINNLLDCTQVRSVFTDNEQGKRLCDDFNAFLDKLKRDGTLDEMKKLWIEGDESIKTVPEPDSLDSRNGVLRLATDSAYAPMVYVKDGRIMGLEIDLIYRFCEANGYGLKIMNMTFESIIPAVQTGKCDIGCSGIVMTDERNESALFSDPYYDIYGAFAVLNDVSAKSGIMDFFNSIATSFEKNFVRESRWKLILEGIGTTCLITVLSAIFGSLLAFLICMFRRTGSRLANVISNIYVKLLQGTPIVVLLMILYYVLLGKSGLEAVWVAIIGFTLNFGAYASEIMRSGIESIDGGQREAALALGYNENQAFFRFIFPQAAVRFIPVYKQEIVSLLKSTSIVGYIAIQDLTKMSDIIRSRTYEAFFPLIATAVIYFILAWIISLLLKLVLLGFDKRHKKS